MTIRTATIEDLNAITTVESECFPPTEAATAEEFKERLSHYVKADLQRKTNQLLYQVWL